MALRGIRRLVLSIATTITFVGVFSSINSSVVSQTVPRCNADINSGTLSLPGNVPATVRTQAQKAADAITDSDVKLTRYTQGLRQYSPFGDVIFQPGYLLIGLQSNGCRLDVFLAGFLLPDKVTEIETQLPIVNQARLNPIVPLSVVNLLRQKLPANSFQVDYMEKSQRSAVFYEFHGTCIKAIQDICTPTSIFGNNRLVEINLSGTQIVIRPNNNLGIVPTTSR